jgi:hypothetical protein
VRLERGSRDKDNFVNLRFNDELTSLRSCSDNGRGGGGRGSGLCLQEHNAIRAQYGLPSFRSDAKVFIVQIAMTINRN